MKLKAQPETNLAALECLASFAEKNGVNTFRDVALVAYAEIVRLRASQFRWISVGEKMPGGDEWVLSVLRGEVGQTRACHLSRAGYTHWAPIPPLPEQSQEEKDEEQWERFVNSGPTVVGSCTHKTVFLAGLKVGRFAREQKPCS